MKKAIKNWWWDIGSGLYMLKDEDAETHAKRVVNKLAEDLEIYVLTREINEYDQDGAYFETLFFGKPTIDEIKKYTINDDDVAKHILNGGGRIKHENTWWYLKKFE